VTRKALAAINKVSPAWGKKKAAQVFNITSDKLFILSFYTLF
jgi:hypothetical protein